MSNNNDVTLRLGMELRGIKEALNTLGNDVRSVGEAVEKSNERASRSNKKHEDSLSGIKKQVIGLVAAYASISTVKGLILLADDAKLLDARLKLATRSQQELTTAKEATFEIAQRTRTPLKETVELYTKIANATKDQAYSQQTILGITETINKAVQISGADQSASAAALMQLGQGLASGTLRGEELNSVLEQTPRLATAIAEGMGITTGQLRAYGAEGKITAEAVIEALEKQRAKIDGEFSQLPLTVGASITQLENNFMRLVSTMDASTGATAGIAKAIGFMSDHLQEIIALTGILGTVIVATYVIKAIPAITAYIVQLKIASKETLGAINNMKGMQKGFGLLAAAVIGWEIGSYLESEFTIVKQAGIALMSGLQVTWAKIVGFFREMGAGLEYLWTAPFDAIRESIADLFKSLAEVAAQIPGIGEKIAEAANAAAAGIRSNSDAAKHYRAEMARINAETQAEIAAIDKAYSEMFAEADRQGQSGAKPAGAGTDGKRKETKLGGAVDPLELEKDAIKRLIADLDYAYSQATVSHADYFEKRRDLTLKGIDIEIAEHKRALAETTGTTQDDDKKRTKELTAIALLERQKNDVRIDAQRGQLQAEKEMADQITEIRLASMAAEGRTLDAKNEQIVRKYRDLIAWFKAEGDTEGAALVEKIIGYEQAGAKLDDIERRIKEAMDRLHATEQSSQNRVLTGDTAPATGEQEQRSARGKTIEELRAIRTELQQSAEKDLPEYRAALAEVDQQIGELTIKNADGMTLALINLRAEYQNMTKNMAGDSMKAARDSLAGFFNDLSTGSKSVGEAARDMARSFAESLAKMAAQALATKIILAAFGINTAGTVNVGSNHTGGIAGTGTRRTIPAIAFAGAPRYHGGGIAGLKPGEVPSILQAGEEVLTQDDPRHFNNGGGQQGGGVRILNVVDPSLVSDYMSSSAGEQVIVNAIQRNAGAVKQLLA